MKKILFNSPSVKSLKNITALKKYNHFSSNGIFTKQCQRWLRDNIKCTEALLVHSCTAALEMCAILLNIKNDDTILFIFLEFLKSSHIEVYPHLLLYYRDGKKFKMKKIFKE